MAKKKNKQQQHQKKKPMRTPPPITGLTDRAAQPVAINGNIFDYRKGKSILSNDVGDIFVCNNNPEHVYALTEKEARSVKQEMLKKCSDKAHIVDRVDEAGQLVVSFQNMVISRTKHKGNGKRHPCLFCCNASTPKTQFDTVLCATTVVEEEKKQAERLRKAASPTKKKSTKKTPKPMVRLATKPAKAASSFARCSSYCYFPVCVYPGCAQRQLKHTPEQEEYKKAYKFLYELMRNASNDALKQRRDDIKKNAKILLPLAIPIVQDIVNFLETSPRLNPKMLRDKLQCLARSIGAYNKSHRYVDGQMQIFSETHSETDLETHSETYSQTTRQTDTSSVATSHSATTNSEKTRWETTSQKTTNSEASTSSDREATTNSVLKVEAWNNDTYDEGTQSSWAQKLINTTKKPLQPPPGFEEDDEKIYLSTA